MRTTIRLDDRLLAEAKRLAMQSGRTLTGVIEDAVRKVLAKRQGGHKRHSVHLTTVAGRGVAPGVDLDDSASLLDRLEDRDGPH